jgi:hypothetical protein
MRRLELTLFMSRGSKNRIESRLACRASLVLDHRRPVGRIRWLPHLSEVDQTGVLLAITAVSLLVHFLPCPRVASRRPGPSRITIPRAICAGGGKVADAGRGEAAPLLFRRAAAFVLHFEATDAHGPDGRLPNSLNL